jgi:hypothetical protein
MVALGGDEDLRFMLETAERLGMQDAIAIPLKLGSRARFFFLNIALSIGAQRSKRRQSLVLAGF